MRTSTLSLTEGPKLHVFVGTPADVAQAITYPMQTAGTVARAVRGQKMRTFRGMFDEFASALQFPDYFGENWAAFDECLTDLGWLGQQVPGYVVVVRRAEEFLADEDADALGHVLRLLAEVGEHWSTPVGEGEWWDRQGRAFHVVLQTAQDTGDALLGRVRATGVPLGEVWRVTA